MYGLARSATALARSGAASSFAAGGLRRSPVVAPRATGRQAGAFRQFCAGDLGAVPQRPRAKPKAKGGVSPGQIAGLAGLVGLGAAVATEEGRDMLGSAGERFEDFNDYTRGIFESIGDKFVKKPDEPWLLELEAMKYPENIPTLVIDLDKVILHLQHDSKSGWMVVKRPFADKFFKELSFYYELVIFSDDVFPVASDVAIKWNLPVTGVLHRDFCYRKRDTYVKDISKLGRNLSKTLIIDHDKGAFQLQPANGLEIKPFEGDPNDTELLDILEFLKAAATTPEPDIRKFVEKFGGGDVDLGRRYLLHKQDQDKAVESRRSVSRAFGGRSGFPQQPQAFGGARW